MAFKTYGKYFPTYLHGKRVTSRTIAMMASKLRNPQHSTQEERVWAADSLSQVRLKGIAKYSSTKTFKHFASEWRRVLDVLDPPNC